MTGTREYLGDAVIYGVPHRVFAWHVSVPEREAEYIDDEIGELVRFMVPPTERIEIEFSSLAISHATGYSSEITTSTWEKFGPPLQLASWSGTALGAWEQVHERLAEHPVLFPALAVARVAAGFKSSRLGRALAGDPDAIAEMVNDGPLDD